MRKPSDKPKLKALPPLVGSLDIRTAHPPLKTTDPFYLSPEWRALLARIIKRRGRRCEDPEHHPEHPREGVRIYGDHIRELRDGGAPLDEANVMLRCPPCHGRKTAAEQARRRRG